MIESGYDSCSIRQGKMLCWPPSGAAEQVADSTVFLAGQDYLTGQVAAALMVYTKQKPEVNMKLNRVVVTGYGRTSPIEIHNSQKNFAE